MRSFICSTVLFLFLSTGVRAQTPGGAANPPTPNTAPTNPTPSAPPGGATVPGSAPGTIAKAPFSLPDSRIREIVDGGALIVVAPKGQDIVSLKITDTALRDRVNKMGVNSIVQVSGTVQDSVRTADRVEPVERPVGTGLAFVALLLAIVVMLLFTWLTVKNPLDLIRGVDGPYSSSKFQIAIWFWLVIAVYLATLVLRFWRGDLVGGVSIPQNLLLMTGLSVLTFAGAKGIAAKNPLPAAKTPSKGFWFDLIHDDDGSLSLSKYQMIVITFLAVGLYFLQALDFLSALQLRASIDLPNVDTALLAAFGLGQGAYLTIKAVS